MIPRPRCAGVSASTIGLGASYKIPDIRKFGLLLFWLLAVMAITDIAATQLAIDGQIEHRHVAVSRLDACNLSLSTKQVSV